MRVDVVDPAAYTPPYDHALCAALARQGADVSLVTSPFTYSNVAQADGYKVEELFYRWTPAAPGSSARRAARLFQHVPNMLQYRRRAQEADVVHWQWLSVQQLDSLILPSKRPRLLTAHDVLPREPKPGQLQGQRRLYERMDAVIVHSQHGARRLREELKIDPSLVHVIPHGAFHHVAEAPADAALPPELRERTITAGLEESQKKVVLFFGLMRPYKGIDLLIDAWTQLNRSDAELWLVGMPRMDITALKARSPHNVRWVPRYVVGDELAATFRAADLLVLPYRQIDQSGVLFTALTFGTPMILSRVGGFPEIASKGAAELVEPDDVAGLAGAIESLLDDETRRDQLQRAASELAAPEGPFGWDSIAQKTVRLYRSLQ